MQEMCVITVVTAGAVCLLWTLLLTDKMESTRKGYGQWDDRDRMVSGNGAVETDSVINRGRNSGK